MSYRSSQESAESTSDSNEPGCESLDNAKQTRQPDESSPATGPGCPATRTLPDSTRDGSQVMAFNWQTGGDFRPGYSTNETQALHKGQTPAVFTSSQADSRAKTSQLPESEPASPEKDQDSSMKPPESLTLFSETEDGSSLRMFPDSFPATEALTSGSFSRRWPSSGFTTLPGELWTADTSECHSGGGEYSFLPGVLEATVPERFYLSPKAAAGILRRAERRGKRLPLALDKALRVLSERAATKDEAGLTILTDREHSSQGAA
jgi:hypothetical protein